MAETKQRKSANVPRTVGRIALQRDAHCLATQDPTVRNAPVWHLKIRFRAYLVITLRP